MHDAKQTAHKPTQHRAVHMQCWKSAFDAHHVMATRIRCAFVSAAVCVHSEIGDMYRRDWQCCGSVKSTIRC